MRDLESLQEEQEPIHQIVQDDEGHPARSIPTVAMLDQAGNELDVPAWTGRTSTPKSVACGQQHIQNNIRFNGYLAREVCPLTGGFVRPPGVPATDQACAKVDPRVGCKHYQAEKERRVAAHQAQEAEANAKFASPTEAMLKIAEGLAKWSERQQTINTPDPDVPASKARRPGV